MSAAAPPRLVAALAQRYRIAEVLGEGGMATAYLADCQAQFSMRCKLVEKSWKWNPVLHALPVPLSRVVL